MHLLLSFKNGSLRALPQMLPAGLYEAAARRGVLRNTNNSRPSPGVAAASAIPRQFSGSGAQRLATPPPRAPYGQISISSTPTGSDQWVVTAQEKAQYDQIFATVDPAKRGFITGEQAVSFFSRSGLPEEALAQIWDLADINSEGQLTRDEFAVAMYLIRQQKRDGAVALPQNLPANLVPPSRRRQPIAPQQSTAPVFDTAANPPAQKLASEDLFGLDAFTAPTPIVPKSTGDSSLYSASPTQGQKSPQVPHQPVPTQSSSVFKPFVPSSSFGQAIMTPQATGTSSTPGSVQNRGVQQNQPSGMDDLLGDNDPEISKKLTQETTELANLSNQVSTLTGQMQEVKAKRGSTEQDLTQAQSQKCDFESRLLQLRSAYEQEVREVKALEERLSASRIDVRKLQQEMAMLEGAHQDLQIQHGQVAAALDSDQKENASLKERIRETNAAISELKPHLEKMRSEARQQKGLVAINKKQLATNEAERDKVRGELEVASREHAEATRDLEGSKRSIEAQPQLQTPPPTLSPAASITSMNPFLRGPRADSTDKGESPAFGSPGVASPNHTAFDSFFGPSLITSSQTPPASFGTATPSQSREITYSEKSSDGPDVPTPSGSPLTSVFNDSPHITGEPPAPPQSRQITSSFLPFRNLERSDSPSSSVNVNRPTSRIGGDSSFDTPERSLPYIEPPAQGSPIPPVVRMNSTLAESVPNRSASQFNSSVMADANGIDGHQTSFFVNQDIGNPEQPSASRGIPGSFPGDEPQPTISESSADTFHSSNTQERPQGSRADPFALVGDRPRTPVSAKDDFDSAFAGFDNAGKAPAQANTTAPTQAPSGEMAPKAHGEFPPIREFGADDESDSDSERGFDDDFTTVSPNKTRELPLQMPFTQAAPSGLATGGVTNIAPSRPPFTTNESAISQLPTPGAQVSPPTYDQTVSAPGSGHRKESNQFPAEYSGLLPSREDQTSSPITSPPTNRAVENVSSPTLGQSVMNFFGAGTTVQPSVIESTPSQIHAPMPPGSSAAPYAYGSDSSQQPELQPPMPAKQAVDEFDDEFADLSEAKEADDKVDEEFGTASKSGFDEFNPIFDSPNSSRTTVQPPSSTFSNDALHDFEPSISSSAQAGEMTEQGSTAATTNHDWDAIFSGLDTPQNDGVQSSSQNSTFPSIPPPVTQNNGIQQQPPLPPRDIMQDYEPPSTTSYSVPNTATTKPPSLARGLSMGTEHDDPILKRLTGMGYPREESLDALEKFDYNIDKVRACFIPFPAIKQFLF